MMHKAWSNIEDVPYCFWRSSVKFQGHTGWKIDDWNPIWVRLLGRSQLSNPSDLPCYITVYLKDKYIFPSQLLYTGAALKAPTYAFLLGNGLPATEKVQKHHMTNWNAPSWEWCCHITRQRNTEETIKLFVSICFPKITCVKSLHNIYK